MTDEAVHPEFEQAGSFEHLKLGKLEVLDDPRTLRLARYLDDSVVLPEIPAVYDLGAAVAEWAMYGNDRLGDCTIAAAGHMIAAWTVAAGTPRIPGEEDVLAAYIPGTGTDDTGRYELDVLNFWRQTGIGTDKIGAFAALDPTNHDHVKAATYLFGGLYIGVALPKTAQGQPLWDVVGDGTTGDSAPGSWGGHAVDVVAYDDDTVTIVTWGAVLKMTWGFWDAYVEEAYAIITADFLNPQGLTPAGFDAAALEADLVHVTAGGAAPATPSATAAAEDAPVEVEQAPEEQQAPTPEEAATAAERGIQLDEGYYWNG